MAKATLATTTIAALRRTLFLVQSDMLLLALILGIYYLGMDSVQRNFLRRHRLTLVVVFSFYSHTPFPAKEKTNL